MAFHFKLIVMLISVLMYKLVAGTAMEYVIVFLLILFIGIPHGATDHQLTQFNDGKTKEKGLDKKFLFKYLLIMSVYGLCWYFSPTLSFFAFILLSAYHFGEAQLAYLKTIKLPILAYLLSGTACLLILMQPHQAEVGSYIVPYFLTESALAAFGEWVPWILIGCTMVLLGLLTINGWVTLRKEIVDLILIFIVSYSTSLLFGFAVFFAFWHSWDATKMQIIKISQIRDGFSLKKWIKEAAPFTLISWFGIGLLLILFEWQSLPWPVITSFFVLVSIITLPHAIVMSRFYKTDYTNISDTYSLKDLEARDSSRINT